MSGTCNQCGERLETRDAPVTGGLCDRCGHLILGDRVSLDELLERIAAPVLVANSNGAIVGTNGLALALLGKAMDDVHGRLGGEVMECRFARLPGGCGQTVHCDGCGIRRTVTSVLQTGVAVEGVQARTYRQQGDQVIVWDWELAAEKVGAAVLLRLERSPKDRRGREPG